MEGFVWVYLGQELFAKYCTFFLGSFEKELEALFFFQWLNFTGHTLIRIVQGVAKVILDDRLCVK